MDFAKPELAMLLLCIPILIYYFRLAMKLDRADREKFFSARNYSSLAGFSEHPNKTLKAALLITGAALVAFAAARPQGLEKMEEFRAEAMDVCFAIDSSDSMRALDIGRENRLEITKAVVSHLIDKLRNDRVGLVTFAGEASCLCPITLDRSAAKTLLAGLDFGALEKGGTRLDLAIEAARERFAKDEDAAKAIIIFTDGESLEGKPVEAAKKAFSEGIIIYTVGIGSTAGVPIPINRGPFGDLVYKKYQGREVITKLNEDVLKAIAAAADGSYFHVSDQSSLDRMISALTRIKKRAIRTATAARREELFFYFAFPAFLALLAELLIPARTVRPGPPSSALAVLLTLSAICSAHPAVAATASSPAAHDGGSSRAERTASVPGKASPTAGGAITVPSTENSEKSTGLIGGGLSRYGAGDFSGAESDFTAAGILDPRGYAPNYDAGCARYRRGDHAGAVKAFDRAIAADASRTRHEPYYNRGNSFFRLENYESAISSYEEALKIRPGDADTLHNLELARKKLEEERKKREEQEKKDESGEKKEGDGKKDGKEDGKEKGKDDKSGKSDQQAGSDPKQDKKNEKDGSKDQAGKQQEKQGDGKEGQAGKEDGKQDGRAASEGKDGGNKEDGVKDLVDRGNVEKYKQLQLDPNRVKLFLKDLENDEARVNQMYNRNRRQRRGPMEEDMFNMSPEQLHRFMQKRIAGEEPEDDAPADSEKKDW